MTNKNLTLLAVIAAVMVVMVIWQSGEVKTSPSDSDTIKYLIQGMDTSDIKTIEVSAKGEDALTLVSSENGFSIKELSGYPAKISEINNLITKSLDIKVGRVYTSKADNFDDLGVSEENAATVVKFKNADGQLITGVVISESIEGSTYVRRADSENVYQTQQPVWINSSAQNYADKQLTDIDKNDITEVEVQRGVEKYTITAENGKATLQDVPENKTVKQSEVDKVLGAATNLSFDDVKKQGQAGELRFNTVYTCRLDNSTVYTIKLADKDDKIYADLSAEFTDATPVMKDKGVESEEELKKKEAKLLANEQAKKFDKRHKGWVYAIASHQAENLKIELDAMLEDAPEPEPQPQQTETDEAAEDQPADEEVAEDAPAQTQEQGSDE
jgi:hypothetical protein